MRLYSKIICVILCFLCMSVSLDVAAQEDTNESWWKKLFKKETVDELESTESDDSATPNTSTNEVTEEQPIDTVSTPIPQMTGKGKLSVDIPEELRSLDSTMKANPNPLQGYRIQIFFGDLKEAKTYRSNYIRSDNELSSYLVRSTPNFSVRIGDFRTEMEAFKTLVELKDQFPDAYVVRDQIEIPELRR